MGLPPLGKLDCAIGVGPFCGESIRPPRFDQQGGAWYGCAEAPEAPAELSPKIQYSKVEPSRGFDEEAT
jgi:hypothetical protein